MSASTGAATVVSNGSTLNVQGTRSSSISVQSGGVENVSSGGWITGQLDAGTFVAAGGTLSLLAGGSAGFINVSGSLNVAGINTANVRVQSGAVENISSGGLTRGTSGGGTAATSIS